jgi:PadR family transcriptional regulator, regulatory protein AphA
MASEPNTTSYAILGLLAVKPWTTYELAQQMTRALGHFWPRAESNLYEEPKKLVALGLARAAPDKVGKRPRTLYSITPKGRRALAAWMSTPAAGPVLEFEQLVRVFFAEYGSKADLLATIQGARKWTEERVSMVDVARGYLQGEGPFPERLPWLIVAGQFLHEFEQAVGRWAEWAAEAVEAWPDDIRSAEPDWAALENIVAESDAYLRRAAERRRASAVPDQATAENR